MLFLMYTEGKNHDFLSQLTDHLFLRVVNTLLGQQFDRLSLNDGLSSQFTQVSMPK